MEKDYGNSTSNLPMSNFQKLMVGLCFVLNFNDGIDIMLVSFSSPEIITTWGLTKTQMGYIFSAALAGMTLGCFCWHHWPIRWDVGKLFWFLWYWKVSAC